MNERQTNAEILIVDNSKKEWRVLDYLREWTEISNQFDIATGYFEIGSLLALESSWQKLDKIRILMGDEVTKRTKQILTTAVAQKLDDAHYGKITIALGETIRLMNEIDETIEEHGGFPIVGSQT